MTESIQAIDQLFLAVVQAQDGDLVETLLERKVSFLAGCRVRAVFCVNVASLS